MKDLFISKGSINPTINFLTCAGVSLRSVGGAGLTAIVLPRITSGISGFRRPPSLATYTLKDINMWISTWIYQRINSLKLLKNPITGWFWFIWSNSWVDYVPPSCPLDQPLQSIFHQSKQNLAEGGKVKIKANKTQLSDQIAHPVFRIQIQE